MLMILSLMIGLLAPGANAASSAPGASLQSDRVEIFPNAVPPRCDKQPGKTQVLFDLCRDQVELLNEARQSAAASGKTVLVAYGADWCIWCHVFEAHILGGYRRFDYDKIDDPWTMDEKGDPATMAVDAAALKAFVSANFVIVNISHEAGTSARAVLDKTGGEDRFNDGLPFVYVLDKNGRLANVVKTVDAEIRRDGDDPYRGYDRVKLLALLKAAVGP